MAYSKYSKKQKKLAAVANPKKKITRADFKKNNEKEENMIIFGHTPREWKRRAKENKWYVVALVVFFALGAAIF